jgi:DNA replication ATP-dependent helicase Dna2
MPGTGKTTTITHNIRALVAQGKSVLLTSYTHNAVDNIILKLKKDKTPILRLGAPAKVHPDVQEFAILAGQPMSTFDEIKHAWHDTPIVATTCLGVNHPIFNERTFDYCIVDEASQITLPICLGPIRMARTFVLVGDHNQLPPLVQNEEARKGGLDVSLFKLLTDTHPQAVVNLEHQYRMCEDIMSLSNTLIYQGRLRCGTESLRFSKLHIPNMNALRHRHYDAVSASQPGAPRSICAGLSQSRCWLRELLDGEARVRFVNTDTLEPRVREEDKGNRIVNPAEARIVVQLVDSLLTVGVPASEIGVMTHYRSQLSLLRHGLRGHPGVEMHTADRFQGRDKDVVVLSLVRSNDGCKIGELLKDWRRINVAFTRAKTKLLVVGSRDTLKGSGREEMLSRFIGLMEDKNWIYDLPPAALDSHLFEDMPTQMTAPPRSSIGLPSPVKPRRMALEDKENRPPGRGMVPPRKAKVGERMLMKNKVILRDVVNEMTNGSF